MLNNVKYALRQSFIYSLGSFSVKIVGFLLLPLYTSTLTPSQYGILAILETTTNLLSPLLLLNAQASIIRFYSEFKHDPKKLGSLLFTVLTFVTITGLLANIILQPLAPFFSQLLFNTKKLTLYFNLLFLNIALQNISVVFKDYFNATEQSKKYSLFNLFRSITLLILTVTFVAAFHWGIAGILFAQTLSFIAVIIVYGKQYLKKIYPHFDVKLLKKLLAYSAPLAFSLISSIVLSFGDRYILKFLMDNAAVGIYALASKLANVIDFIILIGFQLAYNPYAFRSFEKANFKLFHSKMTTYLTLGMLTLALAIALFAKGIIFIFSPENKNYWIAANYAPFLAFLRPLFGLRYMFSISLHIKKRTSYIPFIVIASASLNIILNLILIPRFKIYGAIISSSIALLIMAAAFYFFGQKHFKIKYEFNRIIIAYVIALSLFIASKYLLVNKFIIDFIIKTLLFILYPLLLFALKFFTPNEIESLKGFTYKWFNPKNWKQNIKNLASEQSEE